MLKAKPIMSDGVRFHRTLTRVLDAEHTEFNRLTGKYPGEKLYASCSGSEISGMCRDLRQLGYQKMMVVPRVRVAYDWNVYAAVRDMYPLNQDYSYAETEPLDFEPLAEVSQCFPMDAPDLRTPEGQLGWEWIPN